MALPTARFLDRRTPPHVATLILVSGMAALNASIFLPSLVHMAEDFGTTYGVMQLAVSGYLAAAALVQLVVGGLADRFGRRRVMIAALALYLLATTGTLLATQVGAFLVFRMLQAVLVAGLVIPRAVVRDTVGTAQAASLIGYITMGMALVPMVGPMIGGALDEVWTWRASFVLLAGAGAAMLALVVADLGETAPQGRPAGGLRAAVAGYPVLLRSRRFWAYSLCATFASGAFFALLGGASYVAGHIFGLSPVWVGVALGSPAVGYAGGNYLSGRLSERVGVNRMAAMGAAVATAGLSLSLVLTLGGLSHPLLFFGLVTFLGLGNGLTLPNALAGAVSVSPELAGTASGLSGAIMTAGGATLSVLAGILIEGAANPWPLQALMAGTSALAGLSLLLLRR